MDVLQSLPGAGRIVPLSLFAASLVLATAEAAADNRLARIRLPEGFVIEKYADVPSARQMAWGARGTLFVGTYEDIRVHAVTDADGDGVGELVRPVRSGLRRSSGVAFRDGSLYVAALSHIFRYDGIEDRLDDPPAPVTVTDVLPSDLIHGRRHLSFGPDGKLYVSVGAPCDICVSTGLYGNILRMEPDGSGLEVFAEGVRNSVGFAWHPETGDLWFTDNGRNLLGDDLPPCELNRAPAAGLHFGFPYCHGSSVPDPRFGRAEPCSAFEPPARDLGPHVAPLGIAIHSGRGVPEEYRGAVFIAEHGSWNRSRKIGYRVTMVRLDGSGTRALGYETFAEGWLQHENAWQATSEKSTVPGIEQVVGKRVWGRPTDVLEAPDGSLLVADDLAGAIWRIRYEGVLPSPP